MNLLPSIVYSHEPSIVQYDNWLSTDETDLILRKDFKFTTGRIHDKQGNMKVDQVRQCQTHRIEYGDDEYFDRLTQRVADFFNIQNLMCIEPFPIIKYSSGDYFNLHSDLTSGFNTQRIATMIMYLNDDFHGGCTYFPKLNLRIQPRRGSALVYYYDPANPLVHSGEAVTSGTKFIINAFVRNGEFSLADRQSVRY
jgi:hypothetical protein